VQESAMLGQVNTDIFAHRRTDTDHRLHRYRT